MFLEPAAAQNRIRGDKANNLGRAIQRYEAALTVRTCEALPQDWAMTQTNLGRAYWHFATHGSFHWGDARQSHLHMSGGAPLTVGDLIEAEGLAKPRLVALSACETGLFDFRGNADEFIGLSGAFMAMGVAGVLGTLWPVEDRATALLVARFYDLHLGEGAPPPASGCPRARRGGQRHALDGEPRGEPRHILGGRDPVGAGGQIRRNPFAHEIERRIGGGDPALKPDDVETVSGLHRRGRNRARLKPAERRLEFRRRLPPRDLAEVAALAPRRTGGMGSRKFREPAGFAREDFEKGDGVRPRALEGLPVASPRGEKNMRGFEDIGRAKPGAIVLIVAPADFLVRLRRHDLAVEENADRGVGGGFKTPRAVAEGNGLDPEARRLPQQHLADDERASRRRPRRQGRWRGVVLRFARDGVMGNDGAIDADGLARRIGETGMDRATHGSHSAA